MTCREMDWIITSSSPSSGVPPEASEHITECDRCWRLVGILDENCPSSLPSGIQMDRIAATLSKDLAPVQPLARASVFLVGLALVFLVSVALGSWLLGTSGWRQLGTVQKIAVLVPQSACAVLLASSLVRLMVPGWWPWRILRTSGFLPMQDRTGNLLRSPVLLSVQSLVPRMVCVSRFRPAT